MFSPKPNKINTVVFDFDGTIADTNQLIVDSWQAAFRARTGRNGDLDYILSTFGEPLYKSMEKAFPDFDVEETVSIYRDYQKEIFRDEIKSFPGMVKLVHDLKAHGFKTGIATSRLRESTLIGMEVMDLVGHIDAVVTVDDTTKHKPDPEPANICLERLGSRPEESIMLGDSAFDMGCGKNAGMTTVMVGWSEAAKGAMESVAKKQISCASEEIDVFKPDFIIEEPEGLWKVIEILSE